MKKELNERLLDFIAACPSAWHTAAELARRLEAEGFRELHEEERWSLKPGEGCFVRRNGSSLLAFRVPTLLKGGFMIVAAHGDSPSFKIKEGGQFEAAGAYKMLNVERCGGMLCSSWMDRPLSAAGRVILREEGRLCQRLVNIDRDLLLIPNLAIHMDRSANEGKSFNPNVDMLPVFAQSGEGKGFMTLAAESAGVKEEDIVSSELLLYCRGRGSLWGGENEFISSPRLDDLQCVFAALEGFLRAEEGLGLPVLCVLDNEEVGSGTKQGADSGFLADTLRRLWAALGRDGEEFPMALAESFMISADNAHALHPNHPEYADRQDRPRMNQGPVIKYSAAQRYTTDAFSAAVFTELCAAAGVPVQRFTNRGDMPGGSTLGNISSSQLAIDSVDVGLAQLAMHSAWETAGAKDTEYLARTAEKFFSCALKKQGQKTELRWK